MSDAYFDLSSGDLFQDWSDDGLITTDDGWAAVPSIVGYRGDDLVPGTGVDPQTITGDSAVVDVNANQTNPNGFSSGGVTEFQLADSTVALAGSGTADAPYLAIFLNAAGRRNVALSFRARDLESGGDNAIQQIAVQYRIGATGPWINLPAGYVADATVQNDVKDTNLSVTLPDAASDNAQLQLRIITTNAAGNDEWVGIDDIRVTSEPLVTTTPGVLSIADASVVEGNAGESELVFAVTRQGGSSSAATVDYAVELTGTADAADLGANPVLSGVVSFAAGESTKQIRLAVQGDTLGEANETLTLRLGATTGNVSVDDAVAQGVIVNDDPVDLAIYQIQGAGHASAYAGQPIRTTGIVTAVDSNGFYVQDAAGDGDDATSDAVLVFTGSAPTVAVGDAVTVSGTVTEFRSGTRGLTLTEITAPTVTVTSSNNDLPAAVLIGAGGRRPPSEAYEDDGFTSFDPATDGLDFYESLEGMRVTIDAPLVVSNTTGFGETYVVASGGQGATGVNDRGGITISPGDFNPERIQLDADSGLFAGYVPDHSVGDRLQSVTGVVSYFSSSGTNPDVNNYEVLVTGAVTVTEDVTLPRERTDLAGDGDSVTLATMNVENLAANDEPEKYDLLADNIVFNLRAPDIIAVQEVQDADGQGAGTDLSGVPSAQALIDAIVARGGPRYQYVEVAPSAPNQNGGANNGNIRNGYLFNADRVDYVEGSAQLIEDPAYTGSRRPLVARFGFGEDEITTINVHFTSRIGSDSQSGATQPPANAGEASRIAQAAAVKAYVSGLLAADPDLNVAVLGDFNGFYFEQEQRQLTDPAQGGVFTNLAVALLPEEERYSYIFEGNNQLLDNILVTGGLLQRASYDAVHINSQFTPANRSSDHDPQVARFDFNRAPTGLSLDDALVAENLAAGTLVGTVSGQDTAGDALTFSLVDDAGGRFAIDAGTGQLTTTAPLDRETAATHTVVARATDAAGASVDRSFTITVEDVNEAPSVASVSGGRVREDAAAGASVGRVFAADPEGGPVRFALADDAAGRFAIDARTGVVTTTGAGLDFETAPVLQALVRVTDAAGNATDRSLDIQLINVNEAPAANDAVAVREDASTGDLYSALLRNDVEAGQSVNRVTIQSIDTTGTLGTVLFDASTRSLRYVADADAFDALAPGATRVDRFAYTIVDAEGRTSTASVDVTVTGVNDLRQLNGNGGANTLTGGAGEDYLVGRGGDDVLNGLGGHDLLQGGTGLDRLFGGDGRDALYGDQGGDELFGGAGEDVLFGGAGADRLTGGAGADRFHIVAGDGPDVITDFDVALDRLVLDGVGVTGSRVSDVDGDGRDDLTIIFTQRSAVTLLGVDDVDAIQFGPQDYFSTARPGVDFVTGLGDVYMG